MEPAPVSVGAIKDMSGNITGLWHVSVLNRENSGYKMGY
jgi:hypothetical protein